VILPHLHAFTPSKFPQINPTTLSQEIVSWSNTMLFLFYRKDFWFHVKIGGSLAELVGIRSWRIHIYIYITKMNFDDSVHIENYKLKETKWSKLGEGARVFPSDWIHDVANSFSLTALLYVQQTQPSTSL
jgi:hypothetical protein